MSTEELKAYYIGRSKKPDLFKYDDDGNLVQLNKDGSVVKTIPLPNYRYPTLEEFDKMEAERMEAIAGAQKVFDDTRKQLRQLLEKDDAPKSEVLRLNRAVKEADIKLLAARFPLIRTSPILDTTINLFDFSKPNETRKYPYFMYKLDEMPFTLQEQYVRIGKEAEKPAISVAEAKAAEDAKITVVLFAEPETNDYGFLSLKWTVELEFNGTMYNSAQQALAAEIAKSFNDQEGLQRIMTAESPDAINYQLADVPGEPDANEAKWNDLTKRLLYDINIVKFNQYPELAGRLLETKNAMIGAYIPDDNLLGIGISLDNIQSKNPVHWTGQNLLGKALMDIRGKIREQREVAALAAQPAPEVKPLRKKPSVATAPQATAPQATAPQTIVTAPVVAPLPVPTGPEVQIAPPPVGPRPIRRRPVVAPPEAIAQSTATTVLPQPMQ